MTSKNRPSVRTATRADFSALYGFDAPVTMRAWVAEMDGEILGMAGHYVHGEAVVVFSKMDEKMREFPVTIMRLSKEFMQRLKSSRLPAICLASQDEGNSCAFLERLGWRHAGTGDKGEVYTWQTSG